MICVAVMPRVVCEEGQFKCVDELGCLPSESFCDGMEQCDDGSDEEMCSKQHTHTHVRGRGHTCT